MVLDMRVPRGLTHTEVMVRLQRAGWVQVDSHGTHFVMAKEGNSHRVHVPFKYDMPVGTLKMILRNAGLSLEEFERLRK